ncbi:fucolectin-1-like [Branchiostoma floridae]|uniref:Fucolectin-1-like n=1 Tax=Branchiostoma floridae TaxID=7739 RepID=A0A9J7MK70_BRAFL|nr:fucolectin-1-like [Branchiostoma floridae]
MPVLLPAAGANVAVGKPADQTSTYPGGEPGRAVDGNTDGDYSAGSCAASPYQGQANVSWWVDLGEPYMIDRVVIFNRQDEFPERLNPFNIHIGDLNPFNIHIGDSGDVISNPRCGGDHHIDVTQPSISVSCPGMRGRYVVVRLPGPSRVLNICEVQVFPAIPRRVGLWPLNAEHLANDTSGGGNHGVAVGTTLAEGPDGEAQSAFTFAGNHQSYIEIANNGELDVKRSFTILLFAYHLGGQPMLDYRGPGAGTLFWIWPDRQLYIEYVT